MVRLLILLVSLTSTHAQNEGSLTATIGLVVKVWKANPDLNCLEVRDDFVALRSACRRVPGSPAFKIFI
eukprot:9477423-Pyramimonas_sp.AAC.1